jgi:DUF3037 family protein
MERSYKYAVIRAVPDPRKGEIINIGVVVFHSETVDVRIAPSLNKLIVLDGAIDIEEIRNLPETIGQWTARFDSVEEKHAAIRAFGIVTLSEPGSFRTTPTLNYEDQLNTLMRTLVLPRGRDQSPGTSANRISTRLREIFRESEVLGKDEEDIRRHLVVPNFPIDKGENLYAEFALRNGAYWFTETVDFRAPSKRVIDNTREASLAAIKLIKARNKFKKDVNSFVVYATTSDAAAAGPLTLLREYADEFVNIDDRRSLARYTQKILELAGPNRQISH